MGRNSKYYGVRFDRKSQNFGFHMIAQSQLIADDCRQSQTSAELFAIRDCLQSYGNQPFGSEQSGHNNEVVVLQITS